MQYGLWGFILPAISHIKTLQALLKLFNTVLTLSGIARLRLLREC
jgi:hypothetical protein